MKLALIGGGYWGQNLVREFYNLHILDTICEINEELIKTYNEKYPNVRTTKKWSDVLANGELTAVCISLPANMHYKFTKEALIANKDVYVEKPITLDMEEAEELVKIAQDKNRILMVGHLLHYHPCIQKIKEMVKNNEIGKIKNIISSRLNLGKFRTSENVLWSFAPHDISVILSLCNNELPDYVSCHGKAIITPGIHDITNTIMYFNKQDIYVNINVNWLNPYKEQKLTIIGEKGMLLFDDIVTDGKLKIFRNYINWSKTVPAIPDPIKTEGEIINVDLSKTPLFLECQHFMECCLARKIPLTDGSEGLRVLRILQASQRNLDGNIIKPITTPPYFIHQTSIVDTGAKIGNGTKIWHFSHISGGSEIGENCNIGQNVYIAPDVKLGNGCKVQNNVSIYTGVECGNYVFLGPSCVLTNDINPRAEHSKGGHYLKTIIGDGATIGANATIICGHTIGKYSLVGAGSVVTKDVEPYSIVVGNPAKKIGTIDEFGNRKIEK